VPSPNLNPPVDSITPATVSLDVGVVVPIPTRPDLSSKIVESPIRELMLLKPNHFVSLPAVPLPMTGKFGPDAGANLKARPMPLPLRGGAEVSLNLALRPGLDPGFGRSTEGAWA